MCSLISHLEEEGTALARERRRPARPCRGGGAAVTERGWRRRRAPELQAPAVGAVLRARERGGAGQCCAREDERARRRGEEERRCCARRRRWCGGGGKIRQPDGVVGFSALRSSSSLQKRLKEGLPRAVAWPGAIPPPLLPQLVAQPGVKGRGVYNPGRWLGPGQIHT